MIEGYEFWHGPTGPGEMETANAAAAAAKLLVEGEETGPLFDRELQVSALPATRVRLTLSFGLGVTKEKENDGRYSTWFTNHPLSKLNSRKGNEWSSPV
jgi:hypothetical protein